MTDRIAILDEEKCRPNKCRRECVKSCPVVASGKECITQTGMQKAVIAESLCTGCNICVKACPFKAIEIINIPKSLGRDTVHRFNANSFKLHRLPVPRIGKVIGLVGQNGIGKSTALSILSGKLKPNFGKFNIEFEQKNESNNYKEIIEYYRGTELQTIFKMISKNELKCIFKPQYVDIIAQNEHFAKER